jgi:hypothetical protein
MKTWLTRRSLCYASTHSWLVGKCAKNGCSGTDRPLLDSPASPAGPRVRGAHLFCVARKPTPSVTRRGSSATAGKRWQTCSLPCAPEPLPWVATGCGSACLSGFWGCLICHWLPPVAPAGLHKCSIPSPWITDDQTDSRVPRCAHRVLSPSYVERGSKSEVLTATKFSRRWLITAMNSSIASRSDCP